MKKYINPPRGQWEEILARPAAATKDLSGVCKSVFDDVAASGDQALRKYTAQFDGVEIETLRVSEAELAAAEKLVDAKLKSSIELAARNIESFHRAQIKDGARVSDPRGFECWQEVRAIDKVGLYIPGGSAPLFSTVLMLAIPARIAGCKKVVLCTPPNREGNVNPAILWTARLCGVTEIYKVGGIQAIAAMTLGTESIERVYKIFGPGNSYVTAAKQFSLGYGMAIDMPAGPSEVLVIADQTADPAFVASDLLSQAEHGPDSQVVLLTWDEALVTAVEAEIAAQLEQLSRKEIAEKALANSTCVVVGSADEAVEMSNLYAPEHLIIATRDYERMIPAITNAGSVFLGNYTPESAGDYASGTNHTLPTNGFARAYSGVGLDSFTKKITFQHISREGLEYLGEAIETMAANEGLDAHKNAVTLRLKR